VNQAAANAFQKEIDSLPQPKWGYGCDCVAPRATVCNNHVCMEAPLGGADSGADSSPPKDASGVCVDIQLSSFDTSCTTSADCVSVTTGTICTGSCACGGSTINVSDQAKYDAELSSVHPAECPCVSAGAPQCVGSTCTICGGASSPPGCVDGG
jgi:hypothetical protein